MFATCPDDVCIRVSLDTLPAAYYLNDCSEFSDVLEHLCVSRTACTVSNRI
jgi:hypothetical protein